jgi:hypothetical protein
MELITAAGPGGGPHVRILTIPSQTQLASFFAFDASFTGGVFVAGSRLPASSGLSALSAPEEEERPPVPAAAQAPANAATAAAHIDSAFERDEGEEDELFHLFAEEASLTAAMDAVACALCSQWR